MRVILLESQIRFLTEDRIPDLRKKFIDSKKINIGDFNKIILSDPTPQKEFVDWLCQIYILGNLRLEDLYKATEYLTLYSKIKNKLNSDNKNLYAFDNKKEKYIDTFGGQKTEKERNVKILKIDSLQKLFVLIKPFENKPVSKAEETKEIKKQAKKVFEDNEWVVVVPTTKESACFYGAGTEWCTAATKSENYFDFYNSQGKLYINIHKSSQEKFQFHFESGQFMDSNDTEINIIYFLEKYKNLKEYYEKEKLEDMANVFRFYKDGGGYFLIDQHLSNILEYAYKNSNYNMDSIVELEDIPYFSLEDILNKNELNSSNIEKMMLIVEKNGDYEEELSDETNLINNEDLFQEVVEEFNDKYSESYSNDHYKNFVFDALEHIHLKPKLDFVYTRKNFKGEPIEDIKVYFNGKPDFLTMLDCLISEETAPENYFSKMDYGRFVPSEYVSMKEYNEAVKKILEKIAV